ncbi:tail protein [Xanthomonas phage JGB6]|nr:tail protein [Xanthomonas phage JGB6]
MTAINTTTGNLQTLLNTETTLRTNADTALAQTIALLGAKSTDGSAFILDLSRVRVDASTTLGVKLTNIDAAIGNNTSSINQEISARADAISAVSAQITTLSGRVGNAETNITNETSARTSADSAITVNLSNLTSRVGTAESNITNETSARVNGDNAIAANLSTLSTTVNGHTSTISVQQSSIDGIQGKYAVKIDNNGYVVGFGLVSQNNNGSISGTFNIRADCFAITSPGGGARTEYSGGNWRVYDGNGTLRVRMGVW